MAQPSGALYGRDSELALVAAAWERARGGSLQVLFIEGSAGEGKSAFVGHASRYAMQTGSAQALFGKAHRDSYLSFEPFTLAINEWCARASVTELHAAAGGTIGSNLKSLTPVLWERIPDLADPPTGDVAGLRMRMFGSITEFFENLTRLNPLLCVLDDLHWADDDTVALLGELLRVAEGWPMLVLAAIRPAETSSALQRLRASLGEGPECHSITLNPLGQDVTAAVVADATGIVPTSDVVAEIQRLTGGNPLWIGEISRRLAEGGSSVDQWGREIAKDLPETLAETIKQRLHSLDPSTVATISSASALGSTVDPALLADVAGAPLPEVLNRLKAAEDRHLVRSLDRTGHFGFTHPLIESTIYDNLDKVRLKRAHRRAGLALEKHLGEKALIRATELAHHFAKAGPAYRPKAFTYSATAGQSALDSAAYEKALRHFDTALSLLDAVEPERRNIFEFRITLGKGIATKALLGLTHPQGVQVFSRVRELAEALPVTPELLTPLGWLWASTYNQADYDAARSYEAKLLRASDALPPGLDRLFVIWTCMHEAVIANDFDAAAEWAGKSLAIIDDPARVDFQYTYTSTLDPVSMSCITWSLVLHTRADDLVQARAMLARGKSLLSQTQEARQTCGQLNAAMAHWIARDVDELEQIAEEGAEICDRLNIVQWKDLLHAYAGWAQAMRGERAGAQRCRDGIDAWHASGSNLTSNLLATVATEACLAADEPLLAHRFVERGFEVQARTKEMFHLPSLIRAKAELAALDRGIGDPAELYHQALALARRQDAGAVELQVALSMARWKLDFGHEALAGAVARLGADVDLPDIRAARSLLGT